MPSRNVSNNIQLNPLGRRNAYSAQLNEQKRESTSSTGQRQPEVLTAGREQEGMLFVEGSVAHMSLVVRKPAFCICENKDADQLRSNGKYDPSTF